MCNPKNYSDSPATSRSTVEELHRPIPSLFRALTEGDSPINMMVVSFPVAEELSHHENLVSFLESLDNPHQNVSVPGNSIHTSYDTQGTAGPLALLRFPCRPHETAQRKPVLPLGNQEVQFPFISASKAQTNTQHSYKLFLGCLRWSFSSRQLWSRFSRVFTDPRSDLWP